MQSSGHWGGWSELRGPAGPAGKDATTGSSPEFMGTVRATNGYGYSIKTRAQHSGLSWANHSNVSVCKGIALANPDSDSQYLRICGNPMGSEWKYGSQAIRIFKDNTTVFDKNIVVGPSKTSNQSTHIGYNGNITIGSPDSSMEGGQLNLRNPSKGGQSNGYFVLDNYNDTSKVYKNYHDKNRVSTYFRVNYNNGRGVGTNYLGISNDAVHHLHGHLNLHDGNNAAVIHQGNPSNRTAHNFIIRWSPTLGTFQDNLTLHSASGNLSVRGTVWGTRWVGGSESQQEKRY